MKVQSKKILDEINHNRGVISIGNSSLIISKFLEVIKISFQNEGFKNLLQIISLWGMGSIPANGQSWFDSGVECEFLEPGEAWKKGKVRIKIILEFYPDEPDEPEIQQPESPLDDIRQINQ